MKKDALYYGTLITFIAFFLMIGFFIYDAFKSSRLASKTRSMKTEPVRAEQDRLQDFSRFITIKGKDGSKMVYIPEGPFQMGSPAGKGDSDETPQHAVYLTAFYIDLKEVTQAQFAQFSQTTQYPKPVVPVFQEELSLITQPELPVVAVSWEAAQAYCQWDGKRLPTEAEWEKAAGGEQGYRWPWGNELLDKAANFQGEEDGYKFLSPPGGFEAGRSPYGLYDMAGNAAEWVADWYDAEYYQTAPFKFPKGPETGKFRVYRGGSWDESPVNARASKRFMAAQHQTSAVIGFRCVKDVSSREESKSD